jgi:CHASE3 domain sensor protein
MLLRRRLLLLFVGIVAGVLVLGTFMVFTLRDRDRAQQRERRLSVAIERSAQLSTAYGDQETGERGFVLSGGEKTFLEPYENGRAVARELVSELRDALESPQLRQELDAVTGAVATWRRRAATPEIALARSGDTAVAVQRVASGTGKTLFDNVRSAHGRFAQLVQLEETRAAQHLDDLRTRPSAGSITATNAVRNTSSPRLPRTSAVVSSAAPGAAPEVSAVRSISLQRSARIPSVAPCPAMSTTTSATWPSRVVNRS